MRRIEHPLIAAVRQFIRRDDGAHGAEHALLTGFIASALVLAASVFGQDLASLITEATCNASPRCSIRMERREKPVMDAAAPATVIAVEATPILRHVSDQRGNLDGPRNR
jgi:Flp pilus assembly pilin Flp